MRRSSVILLFALLSVTSWAQQKKRQADSIFRSIPAASDTGKVKSYCLIAGLVIRDFPDSALKLIDSAERIAVRAGWRAGIGHAEQLKASANTLKGKYDEAISSYEKCLEIFRELNMRSAICTVHNGMGNIYAQNGDRKRGEEHYRKGFEIASQEPKIIRSMGILGFGLGMIKMQNKEYEESLQIYLELLKLYEENKMKDLIPMAYQNISVLYNHLKKYEQALRYNEKAIENFKQNEVKHALGSAYITRAVSLQGLGKKKEAIEYILKAYDISVELNILPEMMEKAQEAYIIYKENADYKNALRFHELFVAYKDSLVTKDQRQALVEAETKFRTKQSEAELALKGLELDQSQEEVKQRNKLIYVFIAALVLFIAFLVLLFRQSNERKKANRMLVEQQVELERKNALIEEKSKDITDSINYSKNIQQAIIPSSQKLQSLLAESFVIFKPKDIVSGDFYLVEEHVGMIYLAAVDCTGHGVPGAMLSVFADSSIKNSISTNNFRTHPGALLSDLCFQFKINLQAGNTGGVVNDGVDMALCIVDRANRRLYFSGARNGLMRVSGGETTEYTPNRWGISGTNTGQQMFFEDHVIDYKEGDWFYLHTDGFSDQFGGPKGKKFKQKQLHSLLKELSSSDAALQKNELERYYNDWKGELEQIDDITVIGFRL